MSLRRAVVAVCMVSLFAGVAKAQFQSAPAQQNQPPCVQEFFKLRDEAEKKGLAIKAASERKASPREACQLFGAFIAAQSKMLKYANENSVWCGIPAQVSEDLKRTITQVSSVRTRICQAAAAPQQQQPSAPSLSDALSNPVPNSNNIKTGRGTFDTLTGSPLGK
ncbi:MAG TPA: hypothetical protein VIV34_11085 [Pseudolabrys sp.]